MQSLIDSQPAARAGRREWLGLAVLALPCLLLAMDMTVLHLAVPSLTAALDPGSAQLLWIVDIYGFMIAGSLITMGTLGDRIGRRRLLLIGAASFGAASALAAFSTSAEMLIVTRAVLGLAGATLMPSTLALIRNMFHDADQRTIAIAVWLNAFMVGTALGPLLGGLLLEHFWWGSVFLLNVPVMALLLVLGPLLLPEFRDPNAGRLDITSAAMSLAGILAVIYGIKRISQDGLDTIAVISIVVGLVLGALFVARQRRLDDPLIELRLFRVPEFSTSIVTQLVALASVSGINLFVAQYLQLVLGFSPLRAGLWLLPSTAAGTLGSFLAPMLVYRMRPALLMGTGLFVAAFGLAILTQVEATSGVALIVTSFVITSLGLMVAMTLTTDMIMSAAPPERAGAASAISETSAELGLALGIAVLGSIGTAWYRSVVERWLPPGLPESVAEDARATLGGAVAGASGLDSGMATAVLESARGAFADSLAVISGISALLVLATSVFVLRRLRRVGVRIPTMEHRQVSVVA